MGMFGTSLTESEVGWGPGEISGINQSESEVGYGPGTSADMGIGSTQAGIGRTSEAVAGEMASPGSFGGPGATVGRSDADTYSMDEGGPPSDEGGASISNPGTLGDAAESSFDGKGGAMGDTGGRSSGDPDGDAGSDPN